MSITQIMRSGTLSPRIAAILWLAIERGASMILAADPPGAGKTTLLTALLAFAPPEASVYFTRGWGETFDLPPRDAGTPTFLMINEISDHLPVYSWGPYVQRSFELMADGYSLLSTMHADTVEGVIEQLVEENDVPVSHIAHLAFVVPIFVGATPEGRRVRRVSEVAVLEPREGAYDRHTIAVWRRDDDTFAELCTPDEISAAARRLGLDTPDLLNAVEQRGRFLQELLDHDVMEMDDVQRRVFAFRGYQLVD
jgi:energy-coupling factor transporter ATP-binding protein EcfA2